MYVHAGGKIEALGTGMWAAPRDGGDDDQGATPTVTVETVCVLDVRDNDSNSRHEPMLDDTMGGASNPVSVPETRGRGGRDSSKKWAEKSSSNNKGSKTRRVKEVGSSKKGKRSQTSPSNKRSKYAKEKRQKRQRELVERRMEKQRIKRENKKKEDGWQGRAGGMSAKSPPQEKRTHTRKKPSGKNLPPLHNKNLSASAPQLGNNNVEQKNDYSNRIESKTLEPNSLATHVQRANKAAEEILAPMDDNTNMRRTGGGRKKKDKSGFNETLMRSPLMQPANKF